MWESGNLSIVYMVPGLELRFWFVFYTPLWVLVNKSVTVAPTALNSGGSFVVLSNTHLSLWNVAMLPFTNL
jgi:hypothetical protein